MRKSPPDILITTPESLYLMLSSGAREILDRRRGGDRRRDPRGRPEQAGIASRADAGAAGPSRPRGGPSAAQGVQRIGLSATQRPLERIAQFLVGPKRECEIVDAGHRKELDLEIVVPVEDMAEPGAPGFPNAMATRSRGRAERPCPLDLAGDLPGAAGAGPGAHLDDHLRQQPERRGAPREAPERARGEGRRRARRRPSRRDMAPMARRRSSPSEIARAHHGSLSPRGADGRRGDAEVGRAALPRRHLLARAGDRHGRGRPRDPGRVAEVGDPRAAADRPRRPRRSARSSQGSDLPQIPRRPARVRGRRAADARRGDRGDGRSRRTRSTCSPSTWSRWRRSTSGRSTRSSALVTAHRSPSTTSRREQLENVLDMLDGRYPSDRFAELRPRIVWDRMEGTIHGRKGARQLVVTNAGTIPDRGLYGVHLPDGRRVGELDEEMVYEARPGQTFLLGATTWRIEEITRDRVIVTPAPGAPGAVPFWRGDGIGRPARAGQGDRRLRPRGGLAASPPSSPRSTTSTRRAAETSSPTCANSRPRPASSPPTRRSWSSASATRSATGASASSPPSAAASTPPGASRSPPRSARSATSRPTRSGPTTASSSTSPTPTSRRPPTSSWSTPTSSRT